MSQATDTTGQAVSTSANYTLTTHKQNIYERIVGGDLEFHRYGIYAIVLVLNFCLGGIAIGLGGMADVWQIAVMIIPTMALLVWILAVQPMKYIMAIATVQFFVAIALIIYNLL